MIQAKFTHAVLGAFLLIGLGFTATGMSSVVQAQTAAEVTPPETPAEVNAFPLTEDFLSKMEKAQIELSKLETSALSEEDQSIDPTLDSMTADIHTKPEVMAVLNRTGIEPRAYIVGYFALMSSLAAAEAENEPQMIDELKDINPQHLVFGKQYRDRIQQLLGE